MNAGLIIALLLALLALLGCTGTPPTPEQVNAYANAAHTAIHGAVQDYKEVSPLIKK